MNKLHKMLTNRYYLGFVTWRVIEHEGKHEALVSPVTFEIVQRTLSARRQSGERNYK